MSEMFLDKDLPVLRHLRSPASCSPRPACRVHSRVSQVAALVFSAKTMVARGPRLEVLYPQIPSHISVPSISWHLSSTLPAFTR